MSIKIKYTYARAPGVLGHGRGHTDAAWTRTHRALVVPAGAACGAISHGDAVHCAFKTLTPGGLIDREVSMWPTPTGSRCDTGVPPREV